MSLLKDAASGFMHVPNVPGNAEIRELYTNKFYEKDKPNYFCNAKREEFYWKKIWSIRLELIEKAIGEAGIILDVGASGGFFLNCARSRKWSIEGVEPSQCAVNYAKAHFDIEIYQCFLEDFPKQNNQFDAIHIAFVLEHVPKPEKFLKNALNLLRPGGVLWVEVPNDFNPLQEVITTQLRKPQWWVVPEHHLNYFNFETLSKLLIRVGTKELDRIASFPLELFVLMGMDYIGDDQIGSKVHTMRMQFEEHLLVQNREVLLNLYRSLAQIGMGRTCNLLVRKP